MAVVFFYGGDCPPLAYCCDAPSVACAIWRALYVELETLEADLMARIHLENGVLFLRALNASLIEVRLTSRK